MRMKTACRFGGFEQGRVTAFLLWLMATVSPAVPAVAQEVGEVFRDCDVCPEMVVVPPGRFTRGLEEYQHQVTIGYTFAVGVYEVTFDEWDSCVRQGGCAGHEPSDNGWGRGRRPVIHVSWDDAWRYADWLAEQTGEEYRLLSEAEWEHAARAGTATERYWGDSEQVQCRYANGYDAFGHAEHARSAGEPVGCRDRQANTAPVGSYLPNGFGLFDVLGNVAEWVDDCGNITYDYQGVPRDGSPMYSGNCSRRGIRGGSWWDVPFYLSSRVQNIPRPSERRINRVGFRVARTMD